MVVRKPIHAIDTFQQQIPSLTQGIHGWWQWVSAALPAQTQHLEIQQWVLTVLLPWSYWHQQADKTRQPELKQRYQQAADQAYELLLAHAITQQMDDPQRQQWIEWAQWMCSKYQRTSGRRGRAQRLFIPTPSYCSTTQSNRSGKGWPKSRCAAVVPSARLRSKLWMMVSTSKVWAENPRAV